MMHLLRNLLMSAACHSFSFSAQLVPGVSISIPYALSCFRGRNFAGWPRMLIHSQRRYHRSYWRPTPLLFRGPVPLRSAPWLAPVHSQIILYGSVSVHFLLLSAGQYIHSSGSPCTTDEWTLCLFATFLANSLGHSSIKVYFCSVRALHIEQGFADPLQNCLRLQRVIRGIKRTQGSSSPSHLPITDHLRLVICKSLYVQLPDHCMFWAACYLGVFWFSSFSRVHCFLSSKLLLFSPSGGAEHST